MKKEPTYTFTEMMEARDEERNRVRIIIEYICNKNSRTIAQGGVDYETFFDDIQDLEHSLIN